MINAYINKKNLFTNEDKIKEKNNLST